MIPQISHFISIFKYILLPTLLLYQSEKNKTYRDGDLAVIDARFAESNLDGRAAFSVVADHVALQRNRLGHIDLQISAENKVVVLTVVKFLAFLHHDGGAVRLAKVTDSVGDRSSDAAGLDRLVLALQLSAKVERVTERSSKRLEDATQLGGRPLVFLFLGKFSGFVDLVTKQCVEQRSGEQVLVFIGVRIQFIGRFGGYLLRIDIISYDY